MQLASDVQQGLVSDRNKQVDRKQQVKAGLIVYSINF